MDSVAKTEQIRAIQVSRFVGYSGRLSNVQMLQIGRSYADHTGAGITAVSLL